MVGRTLKHTMHDPVKTFNFSQTLVGWRTVKEQISVALKSVWGNSVQYLYETNTTGNDHKLSYLFLGWLYIRTIIAMRFLKLLI